VRQRVSTWTCLLVLATASCADDHATGGSDDSAGQELATSPQPVELRGEEKVAADNLRQALLRDDFLTIDTDAEAACFGTGLVDRLGVPSLERYRILGPGLAARIDLRGDLDRLGADAFADVLLDCVSYESIVRLMVAPEEAPMPDDYVRHCTEAVTADDVREAFAAIFSGGAFHRSAFARNLARARCGFEGD
jgi:hypothetical protein